MIYAIRLYKDRPTEPTTPGLVNLDHEKAKVRNYYQSGQYDAELWELVGQWEDYWNKFEVTDDKCGRTPVSSAAAHYVTCLAGTSLCSTLTIRFCPRCPRCSRTTLRTFPSSLTPG